MAEPISPDDVPELFDASIPDEVIEAFNEMIVENWRASSSSFTQNAVMERILNKYGLDDHNARRAKRSELFSKGHLDVENLYREKGWVVAYDKPGYNETYPAKFTFKRRR